MNATTTSRDECVSNDIALRNQLISTMMDEVQGMVRNFSYKFEIEFDDCIQQAALIMLKAWPKMPANVANKKAYLHSCVRRELCLLIQHNIDTLSLDEARTDDGATFLDMLQASESKRSEDELDYLEKLEEVMHSALRECRIDEQEHAKEYYGLTSYTPVPPTNHPLVDYTRKKDKPRRTDNMRKSIHRMMSKHPQVQALVQRERCIL